MCTIIKRVYFKEIIRFLGFQKIINMYKSDYSFSTISPLNIFISFDCLWHFHSTCHFLLRLLPLIYAISTSLFFGWQPFRKININLTCGWRLNLLSPNEIISSCKSLWALYHPCQPFFASSLASSGLSPSSGFFGSEFSHGLRVLR